MSEEQIKFINWIGLNQFVKSANTITCIQGGAWMASAHAEKSLTVIPNYSGIQARLVFPDQLNLDGIITGLSDVAPVGGYGNIRYGIYWNNLRCQVMELGAFKGNSLNLTNQTNTFEIQINNNNVVYIVNGSVLYTRAVTPNLVLFPTASGDGNVATIANSYFIIN